MVIEAAFGLGEVVVGGQVEPDTYVVAKDGPRVLHEHLGTKADQDRARARRPRPAGRRRRRGPGAGRVLDENALMALADTAIEIERHYGAPQDIEFAIDDHHIWIVQSRPITTLGGERGRPATAEPPGTVLVSGLAAAPGHRRPGRCASCARPPRAPSSPPARCWWRR